MGARKRPSESYLDINHLYGGLAPRRMQLMETYFSTSGEKGDELQSFKRKKALGSIKLHTTIWVLRATQQIGIMKTVERIDINDWTKVI